MKNSKSEKKEGWACLLDATKYHYFRDSMSLCRRWAYLDDEYISFNFGMDDVDLLDHKKCKLCARKRQKEKNADPA